MKVKVKLFGTLGQTFPGYDSLNGLDVNIPDDARVKDLLVHLDIPATTDFMIIMNNTIAKPADKLVNGASIHVFQTLAGG